MNLKDVSRDVCYIEDAILQALLEIERGDFTHYKPHDKGYIIGILAAHRRQCATCQGVPLMEQLFGKGVKIDG